MILPRRVALLLLAICPVDAYAAETWPLRENGPPSALTFSGSMRLRYETLGGQSRAGLSANDQLVSLRTTLFAQYDPGWLRYGAEIYDSRAYAGDAEGAASTNDVNALELVQAYTAFDLADVLGHGVMTSLEAGRFTLDLGSRRLVGANQYRNTVNAFTGLRADVATPGGMSATLLYTLPHNNRPDDKASILDNAVAWDRESFDLVLLGGILTKPNAIADTAVEFTYLHLGERDAPGRPTRNRQLDTAGLRLIRTAQPGAFDYETEGFYQFGTIRDGFTPDAALRDVAAAFVHADVGYMFSTAWTPRLSIQADYASGNGSGRNYNRFDTLFGTRRADLGPSGIYGETGRSNIVTPAIRIEARPSARFDWFANYRLMWLASAIDPFSTTGVHDESGQSGRFAGQQIEARLRYWVIPYALQFEADAVWLIKGRFLREAPNAPATGNTQYLSLNLTAFF